MYVCVSIYIERDRYICMRGRGWFCCLIIRQCYSVPDVWCPTEIVRSMIKVKNREMLFCLHDIAGADQSCLVRLSISITDTELFMIGLFPRSYANVEREKLLPIYVLQLFTGSCIH